MMGFNRMEECVVRKIVTRIHFDFGVELKLWRQAEIVQNFLENCFRSFETSEALDIRMSCL